MEGAADTWTISSWSLYLPSTQALHSAQQMPTSQPQSPGCCPGMSHPALSSLSLHTPTAEGTQLIGLRSIALTPRPLPEGVTVLWFQGLSPSGTSSALLSCLPLRTPGCPEWPLMSQGLHVLVSQLSSEPFFFPP